MRQGGKVGELSLSIAENAALRGTLPKLQAYSHRILTHAGLPFTRPPPGSCLLPSPFHDVHLRPTPARPLHILRKPIMADRVNTAASGTAASQDTPLLGNTVASVRAEVPPAPPFPPTTASGQERNRAGWAGTAAPGIELGWPGAPSSFAQGQPVPLVTRCTEGGLIPPGLLGSGPAGWQDPRLCGSVDPSPAGWPGSMPYPALPSVAPAVSASAGITPYRWQGPPPSTLKRYDAPPLDPGIMIRRCPAAVAMRAPGSCAAEGSSAADGSSVAGGTLETGSYSGSSKDS